jgi:uncharacterized membrane protein YgaE (UPF0421/DUF939 family)
MPLAVASPDTAAEDCVVVAVCVLVLLLVLVFVSADAPLTNNALAASAAPTGAMIRKIDIISWWFL